MHNTPHNLSLFTDAELDISPLPKPVAIVNGGAKRQLSKAQKTFNTLIKQINIMREQLCAWEAAIPCYQKKYAEEMVPLAEKSTDLQEKLVHCLDEVSQRKGMSKTEQRTISRLIISMAGQVLAERDDAALKSVYNKHSDSDYDSEEAESLEFMKAMMGDVTGIDLSDAPDLDSPEAFFAHIAEQVRKEQADDEARRQARDERGAVRKKSAKQLAKESAQQEEEQKVSQSIREVYRKLASALHPDREPDPQEHARKNALMQRANQAYEKNNLLQLLELQLELEHIDQTMIDNLSEDRLKHYALVLKEQRVELEQEVRFIEERFKAQFGFHPLERLHPDRIMRGLEVEIVELGKALSGMEQEASVFDDAKALKVWLKKMRREMIEHDRADDLDEMFY